MRTIRRPSLDHDRPTLVDPDAARSPAARLLGRTLRNSPWVLIAAAIHVIALAVVGTAYVVGRHGAANETAGMIALRERTMGESSEGVSALDLVDREALPARRGEVENVDDVAVLDATPGEIDADPDEPSNVPSGATGGTSLGLARAGHVGVGQPSAFVSRRMGAGGSGGGGLGQGGGGGAGGRASRPEPGTWKRSTLAPNTTRLRVGDTETLPLDAVDASIRVDGPRARVVLDCLFRNDRDRTLEGTFELRLPNDASPFYFAFGESARAVATTGPASERAPFLGTTAASAAATAVDGIASARADAWSAPKEARMVPRERAAWAYTETSRRRVDPALVEWAGAGVFSARVFPLAPGRTHRVVFAYDVDLVATGDGQELRFDVPPGAPQRAVAIDVDEDDRPTLTPYAARVASGGRVVYSFKNPAQDAIVLRLADPDGAMLVGTDSAVGPCFATAVTPQIPSAAAASSAARGVFLLDTSLSSNPDRFNVWLKLVRAVLDENRATLREFDVLFFDVQTRWWRDGFVANTPANAAALVADAEALSLEGATDLAAALAEASAPAWLRPSADVPRHDLFLLSDGAATWGAAEPDDLDAALAKGRGGFLWAYETGLAGTDSTTLAHLARATGGAVFSVTGDSEIAAAARAHAQRPCVLRGVSIDGGADVLVAGRPTVIHPGQRLRVAGRGAPKDGASFVLKLEQDGRAFEVRTPPTRVVRSDLAARAYGQIAVAQIEELGVVAGSPARAYATHFRVVGSTCSLLMLESEADYQRYGIHPDEDAARIKWEHASEFVSRCADARRSGPTDGRADLVAWLHRLEATPGMNFSAPAGLLDAVGRMSAASFRVESPRLACRSLLKSDVPEALQKQFASHALDYDAVAAESKRRLAAAGPADALRAMSSLVENLPGDTALARDVAYSALEWGLAGQAVHLFRRVATMRPYEPETYRALADALQRTGDADLAIVYSEIALAGNFDGRFGGFREVAAFDYVRMLRRIQRGELATSVPDFAAERLAALTRQYVFEEQGLVVVVAWNTDRTDVDLHVTDPRGEECFYQHTTTKIGGTITRDVTQGFGPEMFRVAKPVAGDYAVRVHYYASDNQRASVRSQVLATIYERWGRPDEKVTRKAVTLTVGRDQWAPVATVHLDADTK